MRKKGFTLVELMVVIIIIGICAGIAIPSYRNAVEKTWKGKATHTLACIWAAEKRYHIDYGTYADALDKLDVEIPADDLKYYKYTIPSAGTTDFQVKAEKKAGSYYFTVNAAGEIKEFATGGGTPAVVGASSSVSPAVPAVVGAPKPPKK